LNNYNIVNWLFWCTLAASIFSHLVVHLTILFEPGIYSIVRYQDAQTNGKHKFIL